MSPEWVFTISPEMVFTIAGIRSMDRFDIHIGDLKSFVR